jgi:molybdenum cofactor cytidylyltransferase
MQQLTPTITALILAAGAARRFGSDKRLARLADGSRLLAATLHLARTHFAEVAVVLRADDDPQRLGIPAGIRVIPCTDAEQGMGHSLAAGIRALSACPAEAIAVLLGDMPWIAPASLAALSAQARPERIVYPLVDGQRGHPVLFGRQHWPALQQLRGDTGARELLRQRPDCCHALPLNDPGLLRDVDRPADLRL